MSQIAGETLRPPGRDEELMNGMEKPAKERETFIVQIRNTQNATWQGTVTWTDGKKTQPFRSALELIRLMDSTLQEEQPAETEVEAG